MTGLLRRSELALPACNDHMFAKGASSGADLVFLMWQAVVYFLLAVLIGT